MGPSAGHGAPPPIVLVLPGLGGSSAEHWQSRWQASHPEYRRVEQADWDAPQLETWLARLEAEVRSAAPARVVLVAHSLSCSLVAHWAARGSADRVASAMLVSPADVGRDDLPPEVRGFAPVPLERLPFPSWVVASSDDPFVTPARAEHFARAWGSQLVPAGPAGHINVASGHGAWPAGAALLDEIMRRGAGRPD